ncbi:MAG: hypothetical protein AAFR53_16465 [Pseudomonadota bacterium]
MPLTSHNAATFAAYSKLITSYWEEIDMLARISTQLSETRMGRTADWAVLTLGVLMLTTAILGTLMTTDVTVQTDVAVAEDTATL